MKTEEEDDIGQNILHILQKSDISFQEAAVILGSIAGALAAFAETKFIDGGDGFKKKVIESINNSYEILRIDRVLQ